MEPGRTRRRAVIAGCVLLAAVVVGGVLHLVSSPSSPDRAGFPAAAGVNGGGGGTDNCVQPSNNHGNCAGVFGVAVGTASGLVPTRTASLPVTWSNPNSFDILVDGYTVSATASNRVGCAMGSIQTPGKVVLSGGSRINVAGRRSTTTTLTVAMPNSAPDACRGATYSINVTATAVKK